MPIVSMKIEEDRVEKAFRNSVLISNKTNITCKQMHKHKNLMNIQIYDEDLFDLAFFEHYGSCYGKVI